MVAPKDKVRFVGESLERLVEAERVLYQAIAKFDNADVAGERVSVLMWNIRRAIDFVVDAQRDAQVLLKNVELIVVAIDANPS